MPCSSHKDHSVDAWKHFIVVLAVFLPTAAQHGGDVSMCDANRRSPVVGLSMLQRDVVHHHARDVIYNARSGNGMASRAHGNSGFDENITQQISDVAVGMLSGRKKFFQPVTNSVLRYAPRGALIKLRGKCPCNFVAGLAALFAQHPDAKWFYIGDEDAFVFLDRLASLLSHLDSSIPTLLAGPTQARYSKVCDAPPIPGNIDDRGWYGGSGLIISASLMREVGVWKDRACSGKVEAADLDITCMIGASWKPGFKFVPLDSTTNFGNIGQHEGDLFAFGVARQSGSRAAVVHHMTPEGMERMAGVNKCVRGTCRAADVLEIWAERNDGCPASAAK